MTDPKRSDARTAIVIILHIGFTYLPVFLAAAVPLDGRVLFFWLWFGLTKNGLINLMHECAHRLCFRRAWANEALGKWVLAPLVLTKFQEYRERHWDHHRYLGLLADPKVVYRTNVKGQNAVRLVVRCLLGIEAVRRLTEKPLGPSFSSKPKRSAQALPLVSVHVLFLTSLTFVAVLFQPTHGKAVVTVVVAYGFVYAYGLSSITVLAAAVRAIAEHQIRLEKDLREGSAALRNLRCNFLTLLLFGAYGFRDHATHHRHPDVPYYQLPAVTLRLSATDAEFVPGNGYIATFMSLVRSQDLQVEGNQSHSAN